MTPSTPAVPVSVIIPTYNRAWCLPQAVASVREQTFQDFELIIVDDGSRDDTARIASSWGPPVRFLQQTNQGVSAARNRGIQASCGRLLAFLDSDDWWQPEKLAHQVAFFDAHPDAMICQTDEIWIRRGVRVNPKQRHRKPSGWIFEPSLGLCLVSPSAVMMRRELFDAVGLFDEELPACEDYDLWLRVSARYPIHLIEEPLVVKRGGHPDQLSRQHSLDRYRIQSLDKILGSGTLSDDQSCAAKAKLVEKCIIYAAGCRKRGKIREAETYEALAEQYRGPTDSR